MSVADNQIGNWYWWLSAIISSIIILVSVISEICNWYCNKCSNYVICFDYNVINRLYGTHKYWENNYFQWKDQKPEGRDVISDRYLCISKVIIS